MSSTPEWHEDPTAPGSGRQRYWDGTQWTEWVMDPGATESRAYPVEEAQADAAANPPTQPMAMADGTVAPVGAPPGGKSNAPLIIGIVVGVILLFVVGGLIIGGLFVARVSDDVSDQLSDLAASASSAADDWESWAAEITGEAEALEDELDVTADPSSSFSLDPVFPDDDDPESVYLWVVALFDTGMDDAAALEAGYWVCSEFEGGATDSLDSINQLLQDTADRYGLDDWAAAGVVSSSTELCPDWADAFESAWG